MRFEPKLSPDLSKPLHTRIRHDIRQAVQRGTLKPGEQLPPIRNLAKAYGVNRLTVLKAIRALRRAGLLLTSQGKGIFVQSDADSIGASASNIRNQNPFFEGVAEGLQRIEPDALKNVIDSGFSRDCISFSAGFPPADAICADTIRLRLSRLLRSQQAAERLSYVSTQGTDELRSALWQLLVQRGLRPNAGDQILITHGAQQALALCLDALVGPPHSLAIESPGYMGAIAACRLKRIVMVPVPVDRGGLNPKRLETALERNDVSAIYTVPTFQNPTAVTQSRKRRMRILNLARQHGVYVIEDDIYADLRYGGHPVAPIKSLAQSERVVYIGSFSKSFAPGLRIGFVVANTNVIEQLRRHKEIEDICSNALSQALLTDLLLSGFYKRHIVKIRRLYRIRRDAMLQALRNHLPASTAFTHPKGGLHLWVMPEHTTDADTLLKRCQAAGVSFAPGSLFFGDGRATNAFRLNYASQSPDQIEQGVQRLAKCMQ